MQTRTCLNIGKIAGISSLSMLFTALHRSLTRWGRTWHATWISSSAGSKARLITNFSWSLTTFNNQLSPLMTKKWKRMVAESHKWKGNATNDFISSSLTFLTISWLEWSCHSGKTAWWRRKAKKFCSRTEHHQIKQWANMHWETVNWLETMQFASRKTQFWFGKISPVICYPMQMEIV